MRAVHEMPLLHDRLDPDLPSLRHHGWRRRVGEMADADFGYVGGGPGKINLYVGKTAVKFNIPEDEAVDRLIGLIQDHDKWVDVPT